MASHPTRSQHEIFVHPRRMVEREIYIQLVRRCKEMILAHGSMAKKTADINRQILTHAPINHRHLMESVLMKCEESAIPCQL